MMHPHTELKFINPIKGFGVVATKLIPKGTITWAFDELDHSFSPEQFDAFDALYRETLYKYCYRNNTGEYILCWDISRYVNHSFVSNCISTAYNFEIAIRDILPGEELTDDYGYLNVSEPISFPKEDGSDREQVLPGDILTFYKKWDAMLEESFASLDKVPQPLISLLPSAVREEARNIAVGRKKMESILSCYYKQQ